MSNNSKEKLTKVSSLEAENSVYDFLYYDERRIGSFLGQFDPDGILQSRKRIAGVDKSSQEKATYGVKAGLPIVAQGATSYEGGDTERYAKSAEHTYDPLWANALRFLEYLEEKHLLNRDTQKARLGQFVLLAGELSIQDMQLFKSMMENPVLKKWFGSLMGGGTPPSGPRQAKTQTPSEADLLTALMPLLPHLVQATVKAGNLSFWCALDPDRLSLSTGDLQLKHGSRIEGRWSMLGVLDALPSAAASPAPPASEFLLSAMSAFSDVMRPLVGRPSDAFGITPLIIFREVLSAEPD